MRLTALALAALLTGAAVASPVLAADSYGFDAGNYLAQLHYDGINALDADNYTSGRVRVLVQLDDGSKVIQFFDRDSFQQLR